MEYISSEEFLKQSMNIQQEIWNWWKPSKGDLFENDLIGGFGVMANNNELKNGLIPLLTEGQLRKFIEDKTGYKVTLIQPKALAIELWLYTENGIKKIPTTDKFNVIQAYWKVACEIASKKVIANE